MSKHDESPDDDPRQSERFRELAREKQLPESTKGLDGVLDRIRKEMPKPQTPQKPSK